MSFQNFDCISEVYCTRYEASQPPTVACKNGRSAGTCTHRMHGFLHVWRRFACAVACLLAKISASGLGRKFVKSALLAGCLVRAWPSAAHSLTRREKSELPSPRFLKRVFDLLLLHCTSHYYNFLSFLPPPPTPPV